MSAPRLGDQLCFQLYTASRLVVRAYGPVLERIGLTYPQYLVMLVLWEGDDAGSPPPSVKELGAALHLDSGTLTPLLKRMAGKGLVLRERDPSDERVLRVGLTEAGRALAERAAEVPAELACSYSGDLGSLVALRDAVRGFVGELASAK